MRKYLIGYPIWGGKRDMIPWLMDGIAHNINPMRAEVLFLFTNCADDSLDVFKNHLCKLQGFSATYKIFNGDDLGEGEQHNLLMWDFLDKYDYLDALIIPQDDNRINGNTLIRDLDKVFDHYGDGIGLVGGRDGYNPGYRDMVGSEFSGSTLITRRLAIGEYAERMMLNTGPLVYARSVIEKVGFNDAQNKIYAMDDYALRAHHSHKLKNVVVGMDINHRQFGVIAKPSNSKELTSLAYPCGQAMNAKWRPILGHGLY